MVNNENNVTDQLYSRCLTIKNASPTEDKIFDILKDMLAKETTNGSKIASKVTDDTLRHLVSNSQRNLDVAIQYLNKLLVLKHGSFNLSKIDVRYIHVYAIVDLLVSGKNLDIIKDIREHTYTLLVNGILPTMILEMVFNRVLEKIPKIKSNFSTINNICKIASDRDDSLRLGGKALYHLESFFLHSFREIKQLMISNASTNTNTDKPTKPVKVSEIADKPTPTSVADNGDVARVRPKKKMVLKKRTKIVLKQRGN